MTPVNNLLAALKYLEEKGLGEEGSHWDSECDCWAIYT